jgi:DNA polymerase-1
MPTEQKPPVYLLDTMAFVFRAYHAMQRSRPMSTRTGVPTAATYVIKKFNIKIISPLPHVPA